MKALLVSPRGFCAGVVRAIDIVEIALKTFPQPIYVRKEIVHNRSVVEQFKTRGVHFVDNLQEVPDGSVVIFSAHGVAPEVWQEAKARRLAVIDATCPLVTKVHLEVHRFVREGYSIILIGHEEHDEVIGTMGEAPEHIRVVGSVEEVDRLQVPDPTKVVCLTQTTLSVDETSEIREAIRRKFPQMADPPKEDICYATQNRQDAVKRLVTQGIQVLLVVGSKNSSNSLRLCEVAADHGVRAYLIDGAQEIDPAWLNGVETVGVTAGASAPEHLVQEVVQYLRDRGAQIEEVDVIKEEVSFALPRELMQVAVAGEKRH
ncbi:MAG: 4-hydroxy-3-methylbut-2-enyl diphosphate reductase [Elusimicrobia bacterium]|nr:4-hydroxy-3-methylbut-2-enyl diphosphate reductase [Elusimicrobiota bacterium]